jgi:hypothetical protein
MEAIHEVVAVAFLDERSNRRSGARAERWLREMFSARTMHAVNALWRSV